VFSSEWNKNYFDVFILFFTYLPSSIECVLALLISNKVCIRVICGEDKKMANGMTSFQKWLKPSRPCKFKNLFLTSDSGLISKMVEAITAFYTTTSESSIVIHPIYTNINCSQ
jgi:hypothetical protein